MRIQLWLICLLAITIRGKAVESIKGLLEEHSPKKQKVMFAERFGMAQHLYKTLKMSSKAYNRTKELFIDHLFKYKYGEHCDNCVEKYLPNIKTELQTVENLQMGPVFWNLAEAFKDKNIEDFTALLKRVNTRVNCWSTILNCFSLAAIHDRRFKFLLAVVSSQLFLEAAKKFPGETENVLRYALMCRNMGAIQLAFHKEFMCDNLLLETIRRSDYDEFTVFSKFYLGQDGVIKSNVIESIIRAKCPECFWIVLKHYWDNVKLGRFTMTLQQSLLQQKIDNGGVEKMIAFLDCTQLRSVEEYLYSLYEKDPTDEKLANSKILDMLADVRRMRSKQPPVDTALLVSTKDDEIFLAHCLQEGYIRYPISIERLQFVKEAVVEYKISVREEQPYTGAIDETALLDRLKLSDFLDYLDTFFPANELYEVAPTEHRTEWTAKVVELGGIIEATNETDFEVFVSGLFDYETEKRNFFILLVATISLHDKIEWPLATLMDSSKFSKVKGDHRLENDLVNISLIFGAEIELKELILTFEFDFSDCLDRCIDDGRVEDFWFLLSMTSYSMFTTGRITKILKAKHRWDYLAIIRMHDENLVESILYEMAVNEKIGVDLKECVEVLSKDFKEAYSSYEEARYVRYATSPAADYGVFLMAHNEFIPSYPDVLIKILFHMEHPDAIPPTKIEFQMKEIVALIPKDEFEPLVALREYFKEKQYSKYFIYQGDDFDSRFDFAIKIILQYKEFKRLSTIPVLQLMKGFWQGADGVGERLLLNQGLRQEAIAAIQLLVPKEVASKWDTSSTLPMNTLQSSLPNLLKLFQASDLKQFSEEFSVLLEKVGPGINKHLFVLFTCLARIYRQPNLFKAIVFAEPTYEKKSFEEFCKNMQIYTRNMININWAAYTHLFFQLALFRQKYGTESIPSTIYASVASQLGFVSSLGATDGIAELTNKINRICDTIIDRIRVRRTPRELLSFLSQVYFVPQNLAEVEAEMFAARFHFITDIVQQQPEVEWKVVHSSVDPEISGVSKVVSTHDPIIQLASMLNLDGDNGDERPKPETISRSIESKFQGKTRSLESSEDIQGTLLAAIEAERVLDAMAETDSMLFLNTLPDDQVTEFFESEIGFEVIEHLPVTGETSPCEDVGSLFQVLSTGTISKLTAECQMLISADYFGQVDPVIWASFDHKSLLSDQVAMIPAAVFQHMTLKQAKRFRKGAMRIGGDICACAGLTSEQLDMIPSQDIFEAMGHECYTLMKQAQLEASKWKVIEITVPQVTVEPLVYEDPKDNPLYGKNTDFAQLDKKVISNMTVQTLEVVASESLHTIDKETFSNLPQTVIQEMPPQVFAEIPAQAVPADDVVEITKANMKLCSVLTEEHVRNSSVEIPTSCLQFLSKNAWDAFISVKSGELSDDILTHEDGRHFKNGQWIRKSGLSASQWSKVGIFANPEEPHPCTKLKGEDVSGVQGFWKGINAPCLLNLNFLESIDKEDLKLIDSATIGSLSVETRSILDGEDQPGRVEEDVCSQLTPELANSPVFTACFPKLSETTLAYLSEEHSQATAPSLLEELSLEKMAAVSPEYLGSLSKDKLKHVTGAACAGFQRSHLDVIDLTELPPDCYQGIPPSLFSYMSPDQIKAIPTEALSRCISKDQIMNLERESLNAVVERLDDLGKGISAQCKDHPCLGFSKSQIDELDSAGRKKYHEHCDPVIQSQTLNA